jgi:predicted ATPase
VSARRSRVAGLPVRRVLPPPPAELDGLAERIGWAADVPAVQQLLTEGLDLGPATVLVGENGSGKSTVVEAIALAFGLSAEGGSTMARHSTRVTESPVHELLTLRRGIGGSRWGYFLRAETMHSLSTYLEHNPGKRREPRFHEMSHGQSFLSLLRDRFVRPGLYVLDEPESALSFSGCLALVALLGELTARGDTQVLVATHSPIVAAFPGATIIEVGDWGLREVCYEQLQLVDHWRRFLAGPQRYFGDE